MGKLAGRPIQHEPVPDRNVAVGHTGTEGAGRLIETQDRPNDYCEKVTHVIQGEYKISNDPHEVLSTLLGSCVATCLFDPVAGIGGMNHFLLPGRANKDQMEFRYGLYAMELLINALLKAGAQKQRLEAKLFGGAMMHDGLGQIGESNGSFALEYLRSEGIRCVSSSLGGVRARKIRFTPATGKAKQMLLKQEDMPPIARKIPVSPDRDVELF